jgi:ComF family protein
MKYNGLFALTEPLADLMVEAWPRWQMPVDLFVPIPLYPERERKRGYNQSALLARHLCQRLQLPDDPKAVQRIRYTQPQVGLSADERLANVAYAFAADRRKVEGKSILLVDDVCTTGATLSAAAHALLTAGAKTVSAYCLARAT